MLLIYLDLINLGLDRTLTFSKKNIQLSLLVFFVQSTLSAGCLVKDMLSYSSSFPTSITTSSPPLPSTPSSSSSFSTTSSSVSAFSASSSSSFSS